MIAVKRLALEIYRAVRIRIGFIVCRISTLFLLPREKSRKTEEVFWSVQGGSGGKSKSPRARFLFATFSFGEAKEKVGLHLQISRVYLKTGDVTGSEEFSR